MNKIFSGLILAGLITFTACQKDLSTTADGGFALTAESVECTEAWLNLRLGRAGDYTVTRDDTVEIFSGRLSKDTILHDAGLIPNRDYTYTAVPPEQSGDRQSINITTMDTTGHDFSWQVFEFGGSSSSSFSDVAIISENDIWAVGEIYTEDTYTYDSLGNWIEPYNAVHWDGEQWELKRIKSNGCGGVDYPPIKTVFAFSVDNILFGVKDGSITHYNGSVFTNDCELIYQLNGSAQKIWGISENDFFVVSGNGFIAHYNGREWTKIESSTDLDIQDIWGAWNEKTKEYEIYCVASDIYYDRGNGLFRIKNKQVIPLHTTGLPWSLSSIWFDPVHKYYISGDGVYTSKDMNNAWQEKKSFPLFYKHKIRGSDFNHIATAGSYGLLSHYNGVTWRHYKGAELPGFIGSYYGLDINRQVIAAVGQNGRKSIITIGRYTN